MRLQKYLFGPARFVYANVEFGRDHGNGDTPPQKAPKKEYPFLTKIQQRPLRLRHMNMAKKSLLVSIQNPFLIFRKEATLHQTLCGKWRTKIHAKRFKIFHSFLAKNRSPNKSLKVLSHATLITPSATRAISPVNPMRKPSWKEP